MKNILTMFLLLGIFPNISNSIQSSDNYDYTKYLNEYKLNSNKNKSIELINYYKNLLIAMMYHESTYGQNPVGDGGASVGVLQIQKSFVDHLNKVCNTNFTYEDRYSNDKAIEMFITYQEHYNPTKDLEIAARIWNAGVTGALEYGRGQEYWLKVKSLMDSPKNLAFGETLLLTAINAV